MAFFKNKCNIWETFVTTNNVSSIFKRRKSKFPSLDPNSENYLNQKHKLDLCIQKVQSNIV